MKKQIKDRIREAYEPGINYYALMSAVFPVADYPRAWNYSSNGGPPGCSMAFSRALREMGSSVTYGKSGRRVWGL